MAVVALLLAWLGSFLPAAPLPALAVGQWPAEWARHLAQGWPAAVPVARYTIGWLVAGALLRSATAGQAWRNLLIACAAVLALRLTWLVAEFGNAELVGAALALAAWPLAERLPGAWLERLLALAVVIVHVRLVPHFAIHSPPITDLAVHGVGRIALACSKVFWYGGLVWLLAVAGLRPLVAGAVVAAALIGAAVLRLALVPGGHGATLTDAGIALVVALVLTLGARRTVAR